MSTDTDLTPQIATAGAGPLRATTDGVEVTARPMADLIKADQYLALAAARKLASRGIGFSKLIPAGAMDDCQGTRSGSYPWP